MWAAEYGRVNAAKILLNHSANTEVKNNDGMTELHLVTRENNLEVAELLIDKGVEVITYMNHTKNYSYITTYNVCSCGFDYRIKSKKIWIPASRSGMTT